MDRSAPSGNRKDDEGRIKEGDMELVVHGPEMLLIAFGLLILIWIMVLVGSQAFGSPPEH
jgi:hypothetical protein